MDQANIATVDVLQHTVPPNNGNLWKTVTSRQERRPSLIQRQERAKAQRKIAVKNYFLGLFPPIQWIPLYFKPGSDIETAYRVPESFPLDGWKKLLRSDVIAGVQLALMVVPQGMAYATLASLPPVYGLYTTLLGIFVYLWFGTSRELSVAPVAVNSLLITSTLSVFANPVTEPQLYLQYVLATTFITGIFSLGFGLFNLGYAVTFVSPAVILGFTTGSAFVIMVSQLETLFGFSTEKSDYAIVTLVRFFQNIAKTKWAALLIGLISLAIMEVLKRIKKLKWAPRPLLVVVVSTVMAYLFTAYAPQFPVPIVGTVPGGLPPISVPPFTDSTIMTNSVVPAFLLTIIGFLQSIAVSLKFSEQRAYTVRPSQELVALGLTHVVCSFFSSFDATGGFSRTAVSVSVGTYSQFSSLVTAIFVLLSVLFLTPLFYYMPKSALAAIIISAVIPLTDFDSYKRLWNVGQRVDFFVAIGTALVTFFVTAQVGIGVGIGISVLGILYTISRPHSTVLGRVIVPAGAEVGLDEQEESFAIPMSSPQQPVDTVAHTWRNVNRYPTSQIPGILVFRFDALLWFANAVYFRDRCMKVILHPEEFGYTSKARVQYLIIDFTPINSIDDSGFRALVTLKQNLLQTSSVQLLLVGVKGPLRDVLWRSTSGFSKEDNLTKDMFFRDVDEAVEFAEAHMRSADDVHDTVDLLVDGQFHEHAEHVDSVEVSPQLSTK
jgi:SulP family sulfate permease